MKEPDSIFTYFLGGLFGLISTLFVFNFFSSKEDYIPTAPIVMTVSFLALGLLIARIMIVSKHIETLEAKTRALEEDRDLRSQFVTFASHEFRKPITAIKWTLSALRNEEFGPLRKEQKESLENIHNENEEMETITATFLNLSKIELHTLEIALTPIRLEELEKEISSKIKSKLPSAEKSRIKLHYTVNVDPVLMTRSNQTAIRLVVENLVENAIHYTPAGGTISVVLQNDKRNVSFRISDSGIGIPKKDQPKIFHEFFRAENARRFQRLGSGIGLYLCKKYIDGHGGNIWFSSEENKGTTLTFTLPLHAEDELEDTLRKI